MARGKCRFVVQGQDVVMLTNLLKSSGRMVGAILFIVGAVWASWRAASYAQIPTSELLPSIMCSMMVATLLVTAYAMISRRDRHLEE